MRRTSVGDQATSRPDHLVCPACGYGALRSRGRGQLSRLAECESCWCRFGGGTVVTLKQIVALPDALGKHACEECGHPEMRSLPDGTFHCPACRSEVVSTESNLSAAASATRKKANNTEEVLESWAEEGRESRVS